MRFTLLIVLVTTIPTFAQGTKADYERSLAIWQTYGNKVFRDKIDPQWLNARTFWYRVDLPGGKKEIVFVDVETGVKKTITDKELEELKKKVTTPLSPGGRGVGDEGDYFSETPSPPDPLSREGRGGDKFILQRQRPMNSGNSPDGKWRAYVRDFDVTMVNTETKEEKRLTKNGSEENRYHRVIWGSDSKHFIVIQTKEGGIGMSRSSNRPPRINCNRRRALTIT